MFWLNFSIFIVISVGSGVQDIGDLPGGGAEEEETSDDIAPVQVETNGTTLDTVNGTAIEASVLDVNETISNTTNVTVVNSTSASNGLPKWFCKGRNNTQNNDSVNQGVIVVNADELLRRINSTGENETDSCAVVLFYTQYCPFCAKLAPLYNALGRVYNNLPILAIDAYKQHSLNTRFGVVAVPTILLFHSGRPVLKFNNTVNLDDVRDFIKNNTGVEGNYSVQVSEEDYMGPLRNKPVEGRDYYLLFSVLFLLAFGVVMFTKSSYRQLVWDRIQSVNWQRLFQWFSREKQD